MKILHPIRLSQSTEISVINQGGIVLRSPSTARRVGNTNCSVVIVTMCANRETGARNLWVPRVIISTQGSAFDLKTRLPYATDAFPAQLTLLTQPRILPHERQLNGSRISHVVS